MFKLLRTTLFTALTVTLLLCVFGQVVLRYLTDQPIAWTEELSRYTFVWLVLLGAAEGARRAEHFSIDLLTRRFTGDGGRYLRIGLAVVEAAAYVLLCVSGAVLLPIVGGQESITLGVPLTVAYAAIPVGFGLMALCAAARGVRLLRRQEVPA